jgi:hypothetical protein
MLIEISSSVTREARSCLNPNTTDTVTEPQLGLREVENKSWTRLGLLGYLGASTDR